MEINPYDNFDNWSCILLSTLQCSQEYIYLMPDCIDLMFSIISENQLPEPITTYTHEFLSHIIPEATAALLKILTPNDDEIETCMSFLTTILTLCTWSIQNNVESLIHLPPLILDKHQFFYHQKTENWKTIMDNFLSSGDMNLVCNIMMSTNPFPSLNVYLYFIQIIYVFIRNKLYDNAAEYIDQFIISFGNYLRSIMDLQKIRNIDQNLISNILNDFYKVIEDESFEHVFDLSVYYEFFEFCFKSEIFLIQLFIIKSFRHFLVYAKDEIIIQFSEWCNSRNFIDFLISKDFNEEIIKQLVSVFIALADKNLLDKNTLYILWNRALHVHSSQRSGYINLISKMLRNLKSDDAKHYLSVILMNGSKEITEAEIEKSESKLNEIESNINETLKSCVPEDSTIELIQTEEKNENEDQNSEPKDDAEKEDRIKVTEFVPIDRTGSNQQNHNENDNNNDNKVDNTDIKSNSDEIYKARTCRNYSIEMYQDFISIEQYQKISHQLSFYNISDFQLTNEVLQLLLTCLKVSKPKVLYFIINILFESSKSDAKIANDFHKSIKQWQYKVILYLFYKCFESIKNDIENHHVASLILPKLVKIINHNIDLGVDFERELFKTLRYDRTLIFSIISEYYQGNYKIVPFKKIIEVYDDDDHSFDDEFWDFNRSLLDTNGVNATNDDGFNQLKECIDKYDFRKATTSFIYFLKSYYFIINLYEWRMKTDDDHAQTVIGPVIFTKADTPPFGLDQFFKLLELAEDDHVASIAIDILLLFITSYEDFQYNDPTPIIESIILPKIKSEDLNPTLVERYLQVLFEVSRHTEKDLNLCDFGFPKHSTYKDDFLVIKIQGLSICQTLICNKHESFYCVQNRLIQKYSFLKDEHIYFKYKSLIGDVNRPLDDFIYDDDHPVVEISTLTNNINAHSVDLSKNLVPECPSLFLTNQHFQELLLDLYNKPELSDIVTRFLSFLPNDPKTTNLFNQNEMFISKLLENDNSYVFQYYLQILILILRTTDDDEIIKQFKNDDFYSFLCQILEGHGDCSFEIITLINCLFSDEMSSVIDDVISSVCNILSTDHIDLLNHSFYQLKVVSSCLFHSILSKFPNISILSNNPDLFEAIVLNAIPETWELIRNGLYNLNDIKPLFDKLISHISQLESTSSHQHNSRYFAELFTAYVPRVSNECNVSKILQMCIDLLSSSAVFEQTNDDSQSIISLCEMTSSILDSNKDVEFSNLSNVISKTLPIALQTDDEKKQNAIYNLCLSLAPHIPDGFNQINQIMKRVYQIETDRWNYKPNNFTKSSTGFVGLTNLGATCYMNSVLQQLFFFKPFRDSVFAEKLDPNKEGSDAFFEFQKIFANLLLSMKSFADTRPFCSTWKGWNKAVINVREQQDAVEFLNMFLDQLPESLQKWYKGTLINQIEGISEEFNSNNIENFFAFSVEIKNFTTIDESFDNFLQDDLFTGENQITADTLGRKIDARKYTRIQTAPPVLILHLKRFGYDIRTLNRNKIYSRFVIPQTINIKKLLVNKEEMEYKLKGVVVHFGNANGGHYSSLINIEGNYYNFNDMNVSLFDENDFEKDTFGGNHLNSCAYLLFYERKESEENDEIDKKNECQLIPTEIKDEIENENDEFSHCQSAFTMPTMHFASYCNEIQLMTDYYINIFVHSGLGDESHVISERLKNCIKSSSNERWFVKHLIDIFETKITDFFSNCSNEDIMNSFIDIVSMIIIDSGIKLNTNVNKFEYEEIKFEEEESPFNDNDETRQSNNEDYHVDDKEIPIDSYDSNNNDNSEAKEIDINVIDSDLLLLLFEFSDLIIKYSSSIKQWRQYAYLFTIPYLLIKNCNLDILVSDTYQRTMNPDLKNVILTVHDASNPNEDIADRFDISSWSKIITDVIIDFYKNNSSEVVIENVDFSKAFKICQRICQVGLDSPLMDDYSKIILSKANITSFFTFALKTKQSKFDIESGFTYFYCDQFNLTDNKYFIQYTKNVLTLTDFNPKFYIFDKDHISASSNILMMFTSQINDKKNVELRHNLIVNYIDYIYPYLVDDSSVYIRERAAILTIDLFPNLPSIDEIRPSYQINNKKLHPLTEKQLFELNHIWKELMKQFNIILKDPTLYISDYQQSQTSYSQSDYQILQFIFVLKWIRLNIQNNDSNEFQKFTEFFNASNLLNLRNNPIISVLSDIIFTYPSDFWANDSLRIIEISLRNLIPNRSSSNFQSILNIIESLHDDQIDEIFNDEECLQKLIDFFACQCCISNYDTFKFLDKYLRRNPSKVDRFYFIFDTDKFCPEDFQDNILCILNVALSIIPNDIICQLLTGIVKYLSKDDLLYYNSRNTLNIFKILKTKIFGNDQICSQFDFDLIDEKRMKNLIILLDQNYQIVELNEIIDFLCINQKVRNLFYENMKMMFPQTNEYRYVFMHFLAFYTHIVNKYSVGQELTDEVKFLSDELKELIEKKNRINFSNDQLYNLIIRTNDLENFKALLSVILKNINVIQKYDNIFLEFVSKMIRSIGIDEIKPIVSDICDIEDEEKLGYDNLYISNLALIIEVFPEILQFIKDNHPSSIPSSASIINSRIENAFYPTDTSNCC